MSNELWLNLFKWFLYFGTACVAVGTIGVSIISTSLDKQKDQKIDQLVSGNKHLISQNEELSSKIGAYQKDLTSKDAEINKLKDAAKIAKRGVASVYDFQGIKRDVRPGHVSAMMGEEAAVFQKMAALEQNRQFNELITICQGQIQKTPDWYTPYLYLGMAQANLGDIDSAIKNLQYVVDNTLGDPQYANVSSLLEQIKKEKN